MEKDLQSDRALAAEGYVPLQREVDALTENNGGIVGQSEGKASVRKTVSDQRQCEGNAKHLCPDAGPHPLYVSYQTLIEPGQECQQQVLDESDHIAEENEQPALTDPLRRLGMLFREVFHKAFHNHLSPFSNFSYFLFSRPFAK